MKQFVRDPEEVIKTNFHSIYVFNDEKKDKNIDHNVVKGFGEEWTKFNSFTDLEVDHLGRSYFDILDDQIITPESYVIDFGAGSGRYSKYLSDKVKFIEVLEPSNAVFAANNLLRDVPNIRISKGTISSSPYMDESYDFAMSIGVLHHLPDTVAGLRKCVQKIKPSGWFYVYLYYSLEERGLLFKSLFWFVNLLRIGISRLPFTLKKWTCDFLALTCYLPIITVGRIFKHFQWTNIAQALPLSYYQDKSFHIIRNDALDRFGTRLEKRFSKEQIVTMMNECGLTNIRISSGAPFWHAIGQKQKKP